jgi:pimeloyl-ACP methyl ester carboxylesterase
VVLLHGFPDFWYSWRNQIPALAAAGYRVVAPDMRGYNLSDKPEGIQAYRPELLARDVAQLIRALGAESAVVVGHDWGAMVAWFFAMRHGGLLEKLVILNVPHPRAFARGLANPVQLLRSAYAGFFQLPWLPEALIAAGDFALLRRLLATDPCRPGAFSDEDIARYVEALSRPGALSAALNYYRAAVRYPWLHMERIERPVLVVWGEQDHYLGPELAEPDPRWVPNARVERLPLASHWVHMDEPEAVNAMILGFLAEGARRAPAQV